MTQSAAKVIIISCKGETEIPQSKWKSNLLFHSYSTLCSNGNTEMKLNDPESQKQNKKAKIK